MLRIKFGFDLHDAHTLELTTTNSVYKSHDILSLDISWGFSTSFDASLVSDEEIDMNMVGKFISNFYNNSDLRQDDSEDPYDDVMIKKLRDWLTDLGVSTLSLTTSLNNVDDASITINMDAASLDKIFLVYELSR